MSTPIIVPKLGFSMSEGELREWLATDGSHVEAGMPLYTLESDKSVTEIEAPASGVLRISAEASETYPVGHVLGTIEEGERP